MGLFWTERLSVGNAAIDFDHKVLIDMINHVECALKSGGKSSFLRAFELLDDYVCAHFLHEEKLAQAVNFNFDQHKLAHQDLQEKLRHLRDELDAFEEGWPDDVVEYFTDLLGDWVIEHLTSDGVLMKSALQAYPYDFKPG